MKKIICELTAFFNYNFSFLFQNILEENSYKIQNQSSHDWLASTARVALGRGKENIYKTLDILTTTFISSFLFFISKYFRRKYFVLVVIAGVE